MTLFDSKFDKARKWIYDNSKNYSWEQIDFGLGMNDDGLYSFLQNAKLFIGELTCDEWHALVTSMKETYEEQMHFNDLGPVFVSNEEEDSEAIVVETPSSSWTHYKRKLEENNFSEDAIESIKNTTQRILKRLKETTVPENPMLGLVIGNVQSGKTANMAALMAMAADNGYNFFIILSGTIDNLRQQTNDRLYGDLNSEGCGYLWESLSNLSPRSGIQLARLRLDDRSPARYFYVCLKNHTRLENLIKWLKKDTATRKKIKLLIIDDEADQAGINTQDLDSNIRSRINQAIVNLVYNKDELNRDILTPLKAVNYIGYTATPYANVLNESPDRPFSLFPRNFVAGLEPSKEYFGPQQIFGDSVFNGLPIVNEIPISELDMINAIHKDESTLLPQGLKDSILWFYCCVACARKWELKKPISMLIHTSQNTKPHDYIYTSVLKYIESLTVEQFIKDCRKVYEEQTSTLTMDNFKNCYGSYQGPLDNDYPVFDDIIELIRELKESNINNILIDSSGNLSYSRGIHLCIDNANYNSNRDVHVRLSYPKKEDNIDYATAFIVIGGQTLSRGLTIEGLVSTFFLRTVKQADTLMQMGRWFGYRRHYELLPRIWMSKKCINQFKILSLLDSELRNQISLLDYSNQSPAKTGIKVKNTPKNALLQITSSNKSQDSEFVDQDHTGSESHTTTFYSDEESIENNLSTLEKLINNLIALPYEKHNARKLWKDVDYKLVFEFLKNLKTPILSNNYPNIEYLYEWYEKNHELSKIDNFNVIISGVPGGNLVNIGGLDISLVNRSRKNVKMKDDFYRFGVIRDARDLFLDVDVSLLTEEEKLQVKNHKIKNLSHIRNKANLGKVSQLVIYVIDKNSKPEDPNSTTRVPLNSSDNLVGIYLTIAGGEKNQNYITSLRVRIKDVEEIEGVDLDV